MKSFGQKKSNFLYCYHYISVSSLKKTEVVSKKNLQNKYKLLYLLTYFCANELIVSYTNGFIQNWKFIYFNC